MLSAQPAHAAKNVGQGPADKKSASLKELILLRCLHATQRAKQNGQSVVLAKALVPGCLGMLAGLLFTLHTYLTHSAAQREVGDICKLPGLMALQSEGSAYERLLKAASACSDMTTQM